MFRVKFLSRLILFLFLFSFLFNFTGTSYAAEDTMKKVQMEMPVLKGDMWVKMSNDEKVAFIWGAGHVITIEKVLMANDPECINKLGFINKVVQASNNKQMNVQAIITAVDAYYTNNSDQIDKPVFEVLWHETIVPRLAVNK